MKGSGPKVPTQAVFLMNSNGPISWKGSFQALHDLKTIVQMDPDVGKLPALYPTIRPAATDTIIIMHWGFKKPQHWWCWKRRMKVPERTWALTYTVICMVNLCPPKLLFSPTPGLSDTFFCSFIHSLTSTHLVFDVHQALYWILGISWRVSQKLLLVLQNSDGADSPRWRRS